MEELTTILERVKCYVKDLLNDAGLPHLFTENVIEDYFFSPDICHCNPYKLALNIYDNIIATQSI